MSSMFRDLVSAVILICASAPVKSLSNAEIVPKNSVIPLLVLVTAGQPMTTWGNINVLCAIYGVSILSAAITAPHLAT